MVLQGLVDQDLLPGQEGLPDLLGLPDPGDLPGPQAHNHLAIRSVQLNRLYLLNQLVQCFLVDLFVL